MFFPSKPVAAAFLMAFVLPVGCKTPKGKQKSAVATLQELSADCRKGDGKACLKVATAHYQGNGVRQSHRRAAQWFGRACQTKAPEGCFHLANMYELGRGVTKDLTAAMKQYGAACRGKVGPGCYRLGMYWYEGQGGSRDFGRATSFFKASCDVTHKYQALSCFYVGQAFASGQGVSRSMTQCAAFMKKSCGLGGRKGCTGLAALYEKGLGGLKRDLAKAGQLYRRACDLGQLAACEAVKNLDAPRPPPAPKSPKSK